MSTRLHRSEVRRQLSRLARCGGPNVPLRAIETALGYPLSEAGMDDLRGIIAALSAVVDATYDKPPVAAADHPHTDPGDGRIECLVCGKWIWPVIHSCKGVPVTDAARVRMSARLTTTEETTDV